MRLFIFLTSIALLLFSCSNNKPTKENTKDKNQLIVFSCGLSSELYSKLLNYQSTFPVPKNDPSSLYVYLAEFYKVKKDTFVMFQRSSAGIGYTSGRNISNPMHANVFGMYHDKLLYPTAIIDDKKTYSTNFVERVIIDTTELKKFNADYEHHNYPESFPPIFIYKVAGKNLVLNHIDTVWTVWR